jgi:hypothetical protein
MIMKTQNISYPDPFKLKSHLSQDYKYKFVISIANSDLLTYEEKRRCLKKNIVQH